MNLQLIRKTSLLLHLNKFFILQDSKRLRTFQVPQELDIHPIPREVFEDAVLLTLIRLQSSFEKLKNDQQGSYKDSIKKIELSGINKLEVQSNQGWFIFEGKHELSTLFYNSPFNGPFKYFYDLESKRWVSNKDRHIMEENVSRQIQGKFHSFFDI